jgi:GH15 family glucan-1,4-alpha-glucosidase
MFLKNLLRDLLKGTNDYWHAWIRRSTYEGSWKEAVHRSALALKLLIYEPTGLFVLTFNNNPLIPWQELWSLAQRSVYRSS